VSELQSTDMLLVNPPQSKCTRRERKDNLTMIAAFLCDPKCKQKLPEAWRKRSKKRDAGDECRPLIITC